MASKATTIQYIIDRIFQNSSKLVTGTKAQEAVIKAVQESVNQNEYDSDQTTLDSRITDIESDVSDNTTDIATNTENIATNASSISSVSDRVTELESGGVIKVTETDINTTTEISLVTGDYVNNIFIKVQSFTAGATIKLSKQVSNTSGITAEDDYYEDLSSELPISQSQINISGSQFAVIPNYGEYDAVNPAITIIPTNCTVTVVFNRIPNFI